MRCNSCWRELEGRAVSTTCGHLLCTEDANKILNNDAARPICDQVLSKSLMKPVDINPNDEWINMAMAGISPQIWNLRCNTRWWPARQNSSNSGPFEIRGGSPANQAAMPVDVGNRRIGSVPSFGAGSGNPSMTLRNLILSPIKRPQLSRSRPQMFTL
ncbi:hypothetical protein NC651_027125 [Populus alba x Populus x berolinensis]|nr:hypothetical protein NC651_027125 [Populus alba x Populus x berolinensis]